MPFGLGRYRRGEPRSVPGVYRYVSKKTGQVVYQGESGDLRRRYQEHRRGSPPPFDPNKHHFDWKEQTRSKHSVDDKVRERREKEKEKIRKHKPPLNKNKGGGGRTPRSAKE